MGLSQMWDRSGTRARVATVTLMGSVLVLLLGRVSFVWSVVVGVLAIAMIWLIVSGHKD